MPWWGWALACVAAFAFTFIQTFVGAKQSVAEKELQAVRAAGWAGLAELLGWIDFAMAMTLSLWLAVPAILGAVVGEHWAVRQDYVRARIRRKQKRLAKLPTTTSDGVSTTLSSSLKDHDTE